jgi:hypothetical protein
MAFRHSSRRWNSRDNGFFLEAKAPNEVIQAGLIERFQGERAKEYQEFGERCQEFRQEVAKESHAHKFTFAELEENEQDLLKLTRWLHKIQQGDFFPSSGSLEAQERLAQCRQALQTFTTSVYEQEGIPMPNFGDVSHIGSVEEVGETWRM